jgi:hypothetical protein
MALNRIELENIIATGTESQAARAKVLLRELDAPVSNTDTDIDRMVGEIQYKHMCLLRQIISGEVSYSWTNPKQAAIDLAELKKRLHSWKLVAEGEI